MGLIDKIKAGFNEIRKEGEVVSGDRGKDTFYSSEKQYSDEISAKREFIKAKDRLFDVNAWSKIPAIINSSFSLYDANGFPIAKKHAESGDFIKIVLPGPLPENWVKIIDLKEGENNAEFTVQPSPDPTMSKDKSVVEHFFHGESISIFKVERKGLEIIASETGKNEKINNEGKEAGDRKVINTLVSEGGWAGFQKYQWKNLTDYLVGIEE
ncbi:MAG TPA: hypothetical protein VD908_06875 [Cytophagales bacterium]|nr:hypothetical protein [Cytophagales bacterium]